MRCRSTGSSAGRAGSASCSSAGRTTASSSSKGEPSSPALADRLETEGVRLGEGARGEVCLAIDDWVGQTSAELERGVVLVVDYGYPAADLYAPERAGGTLRAYAGHRVHDDWTMAVGRQDLTAHVDFTSLERAAVAAGLVPLGRTSQAEFLVGSAPDELLEAVRSDPGTTIDDWLAIRSARPAPARPSGARRVPGRAPGPWHRTGAAAARPRLPLRSLIRPSLRRILATAFALLSRPRARCTLTGAGGRLASLLRALGASRFPGAIPLAHPP